MRPTIRTLPGRISPGPVEHANNPVNIRFPTLVTDRWALSVGPPSACSGATAAVPVARGRTTVMVSPPPGVCDARIWPPCERTMAATIDNPRPVPPFSRLRDGSTR